MWMRIVVTLWTLLCVLSEIAAELYMFSQW